MQNETFDIASMIPLPNIFIHGSAGTGKSMLLRNIFPYIGGYHHAAQNDKTIPRVLFVASSEKTVEEYNVLTPNIVTGPKGNTIITKNYNEVLEYAVTHQNASGKFNTTNVKDGLLIVIDEFEYTKSNAYYLNQIMSKKPWGVRVIVVSKEIPGGSFDYEFYENSIFTFKVFDHTMASQPRLNFKPCFITHPFKFKIMVQEPFRSCAISKKLDERTVAHLTYISRLSEDAIVHM